LEEAKGVVAEIEIQHQFKELEKFARGVVRLEDDGGENEDVEQGVEEDEGYDEVRELEEVEVKEAEIQIQHQGDELEEFARGVERLEDDGEELEDVEQGVEEDEVYDEVRELEEVEGVVAEIKYNTNLKS